MDIFAEALLRDGVAVIPIPFLSTLDSIMHARSELDAEISKFPEFKRDYVANAAFVRSVKGAVSKRELVKGGFAALGTPSSFHNAFVRQHRTMVHPIVMEVMQALASNADFKHITKHKAWRCSQEMDRLLIRPVGASASAEAWHRDSSPTAAPGDIVFGGWLNLDTHPQHFSCQLRTQNYTGSFFLRV